MAHVQILNDSKEKNIAYICDDNYVIPTLVSIKSITENHPLSDKFRYAIYICTWNISDENYKLLSSLGTENTKVCIQTVDIHEYAEQISQIQQGTYVTPTALMKFELPLILSEIDEVLYLDSDIIINQSLDSIFEYDLTNYALAAVFDIVYYKAVTPLEVQKEVRPEFYFNAGVMLLNLKAFREKNISELLWKSKLSSNYDPSEKLKLMDQNALNKVLASTCLPLPIRFNCPIQRISHADANMASVNRLYGTSYLKPMELLEDAVAIHYIGRKTKPWLYEPCRGQAIWDNYCTKAGILPQNLNRKNEIEESGSGKNFRYYMSRLRNSISSRGWRKTIAYFLYNRKLQRWGK